MEDANDAKIDISESEWPAYLYPPDTSPDVEDDRKGLFRGNLLPIVSFLIDKIHIYDLLFKSFRGYFTSPQSALDPLTTAKGRSSKARLHNLMQVTGRTIAYTCIMVSI